MEFYPTQKCLKSPPKPHTHTRHVNTYPKQVPSSKNSKSPLKYSRNRIRNSTFSSHFHTRLSRPPPEYMGLSGSRTAVSPAEKNLAKICLFFQDDTRSQTRYLSRTKPTPSQLGYPCRPSDYLIIPKGFNLHPHATTPKTWLNCTSTSPLSTCADSLCPHHSTCQTVPCAALTFQIHVALSYGV